MSRSEHPQFRGDIQGLRAIAVLLVIVEHARFGLNGGFIGVDIFFVISGFVITALLLKDFTGLGKLRLGRFYIRRAYRLIPAAAVVVIFTAIVGSLLLSPLGTQQQAAVTGGAAALWVSNIALYAISSDYFSEHVQANPYLHTWSLGVEEQFYLFFPLLLVLVWKLSKGKLRALVISIVVVGVASFALSTITSFAAVLPGISSPPMFAFYMMPTRAWEFAAGALLALLAVQLQRARAHAAATVLGLVIIGASAVLIGSGTPFPGYAALGPVVGAALVIYGGLAPNRVSRTLGWKPFAHVGDISYSLYLWHWPLLVFARRLWGDNIWAIVGALVLTFLAAELTYRYVETPFRGAATTWSWKSVRKPFVAVIATGAAAAVMLAGAQLNWGNQNVAAAADQLLERPVGYNTCLSTVPVSQRDVAACTWNADATGDPIYLMGDSNAQQYTEAAIGASDELDRPLVVATWGGCQFFDVGLSRSIEATKGAECARYVADGTEWLREQQPGTVILASSSETINSPNDAFQARDGRTFTTTAEKSEYWAEVLADRIVELEAMGNAVVLIDTIPHFEGATREWWHPVECSNSDLFFDPAKCSATRTEDELLGRQSFIRAAEAEAHAATGVVTVNIEGRICNGGECETRRGDMWLYRDGMHISPTFSATLAPLLVDALAAAGSS